jgi:hypothetical protein
MTQEFNARKAPGEGQQPADYETVVRLLQVTRERLTAVTIASTELETLLSIEKDKTKALQEQLGTILAKDKSSGTK